MKLIKFMILFTSLIKAEYILVPSNRPKSRVDNIVKHSFKDMKTIPQTPSFYANQVTPISLKKQQRYNRDYNRKYFYPWGLHNIKSTKMGFGWEIRMAIRRPLYNIKGIRISAKEIKKWIDNSNIQNIDSIDLKAITVKHTNLRAFPTYSSFYLEKKGKYIFDFNYNQNSAIYPNTPIFISHLSQDKRWAYVIAPYSFGWLNISAIAVASKNFIKEFKSGKYAVAIKDNCQILEDNNSYTLVKLGTMFPIRNNHYLLAISGKDGYAKIKPLRVKNNNLIAKKPFRFNAQNVAKIAKEFVGEPYGWGGGFYCRDCSATTRDFFGVFGIFLSRNSASQAREGKRVRIPRGSYSKRKKFILKHAKSFRSLMYVPGHIVLYLGKYKNEPVIMHTYWGVRKKDFSKIITARTIITTLEAGKERNDTRAKSRLIYTLKDIITF
jgi:cell wall-associated NlpC family hydrolase